MGKDISRCICWARRGAYGHCRHRPDPTGPGRGGSAQGLLPEPNEFEKVTLPTAKAGAAIVRIDTDTRVEFAAAAIEGFNGAIVASVASFVPAPASPDVSVPSLRAQESRSAAGTACDRSGRRRAAGAAEVLAGQGVEVHVVLPGSEAGTALPVANRHMLIVRLFERGSSDGNEDVRLDFVDQRAVCPQEITPLARPLLLQAVLKIHVGREAHDFVNRAGKVRPDPNRGCVQPRGCRVAQQLRHGIGLAGAGSDEADFVRVACGRRHGERKNRGQNANRLMLIDRMGARRVPTPALRALELSSQPLARRDGGLCANIAFLTGVRSPAPAVF